MYLQKYFRKLKLYRCNEIFWNNWDKFCDNISIAIKDWKYFWHISAIFCAMWVVYIHRNYIFGFTCELLLFFSLSFYENLVIRMVRIRIWHENRSGKRPNFCLHLTCEKRGAKVCPSARAEACPTARTSAFFQFKFK